uniref:RCB1 n=1 Tax=Pholiota microspora TaxID=1538424 RepID=Q33DU6_PHOMI|nr:RCB1 [Pholiota nameko]
MANSFDNSYPAFPILAFLSFILVLIPLPWHFQAWNSGTCLYMIWTAIACLNQFINSIIWHGNAIDWAPLWCDISTRITVGVAVAIPAASLCINRRLYKIATCQTASISIADKRRAVVVDLVIGLGIPALQMALQFIVQGHRYDIFEDIGCFPTTYNTPPAYPLSFLWPNIISAVSACYCILTLRAFMRRRAQFSQLISSTASLSINRYFRLMCLATCEIIFTVPLSSYGLYLNITTKPIYRWISWSDTHFDWYTIGAFPAILWRSNSLVVIPLELNRWSIILCALVFFAFFGFAGEARKHYLIVLRAIVNRLGVSRLSKQNSGFDNSKTTMESGAQLPRFMQKPSHSTKRDSWISTTSIDTERPTNYSETDIGSPTFEDKKASFSKLP